MLHVNQSQIRLTAQGRELRLGVTRGWPSSDCVTPGVYLKLKVYTLSINEYGVRSIETSSSFNECFSCCLSEEYSRLHVCISMISTATCSSECQSFYKVYYLHGIVMATAYVILAATSHKISNTQLERDAGDMFVCKGNYNFA